MLRIGPRLSALVVGAALAFVLAAGSVVVHRPQRMVGGNMCETTNDNPHGYCYQQLPTGGWPFAFLFDSPAASVVGRLGFEDDFKPGRFLLDVAVFGVLPAAGAVVIGLRRRRSKVPQEIVRQSSS
jgi:hypothetical protein